MDTKKKILVVDDDENLRTVLLDKLEAAGLSGTGAANGEEGLKQALALHPDVILLDVMMPKMNGWQTLEALRADAWGKTARVVMLTSMDDANDVAKALSKGVHEYFAKTKFSPDDLVKLVMA